MTDTITTDTITAVRQRRCLGCGRFLPKKPSLSQRWEDENSDSDVCRDEWRCSCGKGLIVRSLVLPEQRS
jgi:hypothetical protein